MKRLIYTFLFLGTIFGCSKTDTTPVTPKPTADFSWTETNGVIQFTNNSKNADSYQWDFGDNLGKSTSQNPKYTFEYKGDYQVKLTAKGAGGDAEAINTIKITTGKEPKPIPNFDIKDLGTGNFQFTNTSQYADTYSWDFGDGSAVATTKDTQHQFYSNAKFKVTLTATGKGGKENKIQEIEAKNVPDPRDTFVGTWSRIVKSEGSASEEKTSVGITKSELDKNNVILKVIIAGISTTWSAQIKGQNISYVKQPSELGLGEYAGDGVLSEDGKKINLTGTYTYKSTLKVTKLTELWTKQ